MNPIMHNVILGLGIIFCGVVGITIGAGGIWLNDNFLKMPRWLAIVFIVLIGSICGGLIMSGLVATIH